MTTQEFKNCITILFHMEKDIYMKLRLIEGLTEKIREKEEEKENLLNEIHSKSPQSPTLKTERKNTVWENLFSENPVYDFWDECFLGLDGLGGILIMIVTFIIMLPLILVVGIIRIMTENGRNEKINRKHKAVYDREYEVYERQLATYNRACENAESYCRRTDEKINELAQQKKSLEDDLEQTRKKLAEFYDAMEINEKFRGLVPMSYMSEYVNLGIATKLEGADGLYYLIRKELQDAEFVYTVTSKLDALIGGIESSHKALRKEIDDMKERSYRMVLTAASSTQRQSGISEYQADSISRELRYQTYLLSKM